MPLLTNPSSTRSYLSRELSTLSDADPQILADYILALLRHDKPIDEMKQVCLENLHDFLHERTDNFVDRLFEYLLKGENPSTSTNNSTVQVQPQPDPQWQFSKHESGSEDRQHHRHDRRKERERELSPESRHRKPFPSDRPSSRYKSLPFPFPPPPMPFGIQPPFGVQTDRNIRLPPPSHRGRRNFGGGGDTRLVVDRIPYEHCSISSVNTFFSKFGNLTNVTVNPDQRRARIQFATSEEANQAYHSADAIFDNRFVKLYWDREGEDIPAPQLSKSFEVVKDVPMSSNPPTLASTINIATAKRQEALKTMLNLQRQQQELLTRYIDQQKALMIRLESGNVSDADKAELMDSLRNVDSLIMSMRESMQTVEVKLSEITNQNVTVGDASPKSEYKSPVLRGGPTKRVSSRGRPRATTAQSYKLDMRPRSLLLKPVPVRVGRDIDSLRKLFEPFGGIKSIKVIDSTDGTDSVGALVEFGLRHEAEQAMFYMGKSDLGEPFELQWVQQQPQPTQSNPSQTLQPSTPFDADVNMSDTVEGEHIHTVNDQIETNLQVEDQNI